MIPPLLPLLVAAVFPQEPQDWPGWRGPGHDAVSPETRWSPVGAPEPLWKREVGLGYSSFAVARGALYTLGHDPEQKLDHVLSLDALTGAERWRHTFAAETMDNFHGGGTVTTPLVVGDVVYVSQREGRAFAFRAADGELLWERNYAEELELRANMYGYTNSPLFYEDMLVFVQGGSAMRVDPATGDVLWRGEDYGDGGYADPAPFRYRGAPCLALLRAPGVVVVDLASGEELHRYPWPPTAGAIRASTPIPLPGDRIFASASRGMGSVLLQLGEETEPELVWHTRAMRNRLAGCVPWDGHLYGFDEGMLKCIDLEGEEQWRVRGFGMGSVTIAGGRLLVLSSKGDLLVAEARPDGFEELSRTRVFEGGGECWTIPVLVGGLIYCRNSGGELVCVDHRGDGTPVAAAVQVVPETVPDARALYAQHAAAVGAAVLADRPAQRIEGEIEVSGEGVTRSKVTISRDGARYHRRIDLGEYGELVRAFDGEIGWGLDIFDGNRLVEGAELRWMSETLPLGRDRDWEAAYSRLATEGAADFDGRPAWKVAATSAGGAERTLWFHRESGLLIGAEGADEPMTVFADYRSFDGFLMPTFVRLLLPDTGIEERLYVESVAWEVEPERFERPEAVLRMLRTPEEIAAADELLREAHAACLGRYVADFPPYDGAEWEVRVQDGDLAVVWAGQAFPLVPGDEPGRFTFAQSPAMTLEAETDESGAVTGLRFTFGDEENVLSRVVPDAIDPFVARLDELVPELLADYAVPGAAVALIRGGEVVAAKGYGRSDEEGTPVTADTVFNVGSISKSLAAWGVMTLVERGEVDIDAPVSRYLTRWRLPDSEFDADGVTVRRLLSHTAGLSLHGYPGFDTEEELPTVEESLDGRTNGSGRVELIHEPGTKWKYSGGGYTIAQLLVEEVSGRSFADYMRDEVFAPLGLERTDYRWPEELRPLTSTPYDGEGAPVINPRFTAEAAASLNTTARSLARFAAAFAVGPDGEPPGRGVLSPETVAVIATPQPATDGGYGLGVSIGADPDGQRHVGHGGSNRGWRAWWRVVPESGDGFLLLTNGSAGGRLRSVLSEEWNAHRFPEVPEGEEPR